MGLFGPSKSEIMHQRVNDVEVFYERMVKVFEDNIIIKEKPDVKDSNGLYNIRMSYEAVERMIKNKSAIWDNSVKEYYERAIEVLGDSESAKYMTLSACRSQSRINWSRLYYVKHLFELYPKTLLDDKNYLQIEFRFSGLGLKYSAPVGMLCEPPAEAKQRIYLFVNNNAMSDIQRITTDFFQILEDNISIIGKKKDKYPQLHMRLVAMYYRTRGAIAWFNYLDKKSI